VYAVIVDQVSDVLGIVARWAAGAAGEAPTPQGSAGRDREAAAAMRRHHKAFTPPAASRGRALGGGPRI